MSLNENYKKFLAGKLSKQDYIKTNYEETYHSLFDVSEFLQSTDLQKIELIQGDVIATYKTGMKLICEKNEYRTAPLETLNFLKYEPEELAIFNKLIMGKSCFYDIGGNIGFYAIHAVVMNPDLQVKSFEPVPKMFGVLNKNIQINSMMDKIEAVNRGLSDSEGDVSFYVYPFGGTNASLVNVSDSEKAVEVKAKILPLDSYINEGHPLPDIIKCDVEGAEKLVLKGGLETIRRAKPVLFFELLRKWSAKFGYHPNEVLQMLRDEGYGCFVAHKGALKEFNSVSEETKETNFFFLHPETHAHHLKELVKL